MEELRRMLSFSESTLSTKQEENAMVDNVDLYILLYIVVMISYLQKVNDSCNLLSSTTVKEEFAYKTQKEELTDQLNSLENEKQYLWVE